MEISIEQWGNEIKPNVHQLDSEYLEHLDFNLFLLNDWYCIERMVLEKHIHSNGTNKYYTIYEEILYNIVNKTENIEKIKDELMNHEVLGELELKAVFTNEEEAYKYISEYYPPYKYFSKMVDKIEKFNQMTENKLN